MATDAAHPLTLLIKAELARQRRPLAIAAFSGVALTAASAGLLGLSGWFITGAAAAGTAGASLVFNTMLPSAGIRLFAIVKTTGRYGERLTGHQAALRGLAHIRPALFRGLAAAPAQQALALSTGEASARLVQDVDAVETLFVRISGRWCAGAALICGVLLTGLASLPAAATLAALFGVQVVLGRELAKRLSRPPSEKLHQAIGRMKDAYASLAAAAPELVCYGLKDWAVARIDEESFALAEARNQLVAAQGWQSALAASLAAMAGITTMLLSSSAPLPLVALATLASIVTMDGAGGLIRAFEQDGAVQEAKRRLNPLLAARSHPGRRFEDRSEHRLRLAAGGMRLLLRPGERLGVLGPSGSGKTTLIEQLMRLRACPRGVGFIDAFDIVDLCDADARKLFAYAPQEPTLLSASIRENLLLAAPEASETDLWNVLSDANLDAKVRNLPQRLDAWIGEGGERLSGGERRRLALARAYLRPAPWLVLDEPTEGLDPEAEREVLQRLHSRLTRTRQGLLVVSHRPAVLTLGLQLLRLGKTEATHTRNAA